MGHSHQASVSGAEWIAPRTAPAPTVPTLVVGGESIAVPERLLPAGGDGGSSSTSSRRGSTGVCGGDTGLWVPPAAGDASGPESAKTNRMTTSHGLGRISVLEVADPRVAIGGELPVRLVEDANALESPDIDVRHVHSITHVPAVEKNAVMRAPCQRRCPQAPTGGAGRPEAPPPTCARQTQQETWDHPWDYFVEVHVA